MEVTLIIEKTIKEKKLKIVRKVNVGVAGHKLNLSWEEAIELEDKLRNAMRYQNFKEGSIENFSNSPTNGRRSSR